MPAPPPPPPPRRRPPPCAPWRLRRLRTSSSPSRRRLQFEHRAFEPLERTRAAIACSTPATCGVRGVIHADLLVERAAGARVCRAARVSAALFFPRRRAPAPALGARARVLQRGDALDELARLRLRLLLEQRCCAALEQRTPSARAPRAADRRVERALINEEIGHVVDARRAPPALERSRALLHLGEPALRSCSTLLMWTRDWVLRPVRSRLIFAAPLLLFCAVGTPNHDEEPPHFFGFLPDLMSCSAASPTCCAASFYFAT